MAKVKGWYMKVIEDAGDNYDGVFNDDVRGLQQQQEQDEVQQEFSEWVEHEQ